MAAWPSVSTVKEITTGIPQCCAARVTPIASPVCVMVNAETRSASVSAKVAICSLWYPTASPGSISVDGLYASSRGPIQPLITNGAATADS